ncbi:hypothetical protein GCM10010465_06820 [Actinomadura fibrosa]
MDDEASILGAWVETAPVEGRTQLYFSPGNHLTMVKEDGHTEEFIYRLGEKTIFITIDGPTEGSSELYFEFINNNKFKIDKLYPYIPEAEPIILIFERQ